MQHKLSVITVTITPYSPFLIVYRVEASHANVHARAIAFFSYIWFKYHILSLHCCKLGQCSGYRTQLSTLRTWIQFAVGLRMCDTVCRNLEGNAQSYLFLLQNLALQLGLGQRCQPEGIAITWQQLFCLWKRHIVTLECGSLHKFCMTSSSLFIE